MKNIKNFIFASFGFFASFPVFGQLSGNYTIGGTTSTTNYATWADFAAAFNNNGVSGAVNVTVMANLSITSAIQLTQNSTNPTTSTKTLTINGNSKTLSGSPTYEMILVEWCGLCTNKEFIFIAFWFKCDGTGN